MGSAENMKRGLLVYCFQLIPTAIHCELDTSKYFSGQKYKSSNNSTLK